MVAAAADADLSAVAWRPARGRPSSRISGVNTNDDAHVGATRLVYRFGIRATGSQSVSELACVESVPAALAGQQPRSPMGSAPGAPDASTLRVTVNGPAEGSGAACILRVIGRN